MSHSKLFLEQYYGKVRDLGRSLDFYTVLEKIGSDAPLLAWGGRQSRFAGIALEWEERDPDQLWQMRLNEQQPAASGGHGLPVFLGGWVGLRAYEKLPGLVSDRVFRVSRFLLFDQSDGAVYELDENIETKLAFSMDCEELLSRPRKKHDLPVISPIQWSSQATDREYLDLVEQCLQDIRQGRYYQINLLRYFTLDSDTHYLDWLARHREFSGPFSCILRLSDLEIYSFSPERFVQVHSNGHGLQIVTEPIKGTAPVVADPIQNEAFRTGLANSSKDLAELQMIVDLMRNDLHRVCQAGSVRVNNSGAVHSFANVHHLIAQLSGQLQVDLRLGDLLAAICPGGSITGAPKCEVMKAIREYERRDRAYFMGNFLMWSPQSAYLDSSILIRTVQRLGSAPTEFAAGSGLVIRSQPHEELAEIKAKCRVVMD